MRTTCVVWRGLTRPERGGDAQVAPSVRRVRLSARGAHALFRRPAWFLFCTKRVSRLTDAFARQVPGRG
eukprot:790858-Lingulodinium_polyedra.AAC.1